jgi:solute carrier family 25 phosphate transporter 23/24/25/41
MDDLKYLSSGAMAGAVSRTLTAPLERIKIFNQVQDIASPGGVRYTSVFSSLRLMWQTEGLRGYFKGNGTNCVKVVPTQAIRFVTFENLKKYLMRPGEKNLDTTSKLMAGSGAGIVATMTTFPLDLIRTRLSLQTTTQHYNGIVHAFRSIYGAQGIKGLYRGCGTAIMSVAPFSALNFTTYETIKELTARHIEKPPLLLSAGYGAMAGCISMTILYPMDLLKRRLMVQGHGEFGGTAYRSGFHAFTTIVAREGPRALYKGLAASYLKVIPTTSITWLTYEGMKIFLGAPVVKK